MKGIFHEYSFFQMTHICIFTYVLYKLQNLLNIPFVNYNLVLFICCAFRIIVYLIVIILSFTQSISLHNLDTCTY